MCLEIAVSCHDITVLCLDTIVSCHDMKFFKWPIWDKRNNVETTDFQYSFHTRNGKTRYRGLLKHRTHAYNIYMAEPQKDCNIPDFNISKNDICPFRAHQRSFWLFHSNFSKDIHYRSRLPCFTQNDHIIWQNSKYATF